MKVDIQNIIIECDGCGCQIKSEISGLGVDNDYGIKISVDCSDCACAPDKPANNKGE